MFLNGPQCFPFTHWGGTFTHKKQWHCQSQLQGCRTRTSMFLNGPQCFSNPLIGVGTAPTSGDGNAKANSAVAAKGPQCILNELQCFPFLALGWASHTQEAMALPKPTPGLPHKDLNVSQWTSMFFQSTHWGGHSTLKMQWQCHKWRWQFIQSTHWGGRSTLKKQWQCKRQLCG